MVEVQKRKIQWAISLLLVMLYFSGLTAEAQYGGGSGEPNDPYLIYTAEQMNAIGADSGDWDKQFKLVADIDLAGYTGTDFNIIGYWRSYSNNRPFRGVFDGNGHTISNFSYTSTDRSHIGLFGYVEGKNALIKDLGLIDPNVDAGTGSVVGSLVAWLREGTVTGCYTEGGSVSGSSSVGGLVGRHYMSTITNCYSTGSVSGDSRVGGLVGANLGKITSCNATGRVSGVNNVGGLLGSNGRTSDYFSYPGTISNCYSAGTVSGDWYVGGLVGCNESGTIINSYATATVSGGSYVGGLAGLNSCTINNSYTTGSVSGTGSYVGGLVGQNVFDFWGGMSGLSGNVTDSFWDIETSGQSTSDGGMGKMTAEMQDPNTFVDAGWCFLGDPNVGPNYDWAEPSGGGYPILGWQLSPLPVTFSGGTGEPDDPYLISTGDELNSIGHNPRLMTAHFKLISDIDLTDLDFFIIGSSLFPFAGVFEGNGHKISNFSYSSTDRDSVGLFGYVGGWGSGAVIKDLGLIDPNINTGTGNYVGSLVGTVAYGSAITNCYVEGGSVEGDSSVGCLVGYNVGTITNCSATSSISGNDGVGGLVGSNSGPITNCYSTGSVSGDERVGGLVGFNEYGTITDCYSIGGVTGTTDVGGLVGALYSGRITNCYSTGSVTGGLYVGGLVGENDGGTITNCYSMGSVSGDNRVAGLVGFNEYGTITDCYSSVIVTGKYCVGGLVGENRHGTITNCYSMGSASGDNRVAGLVGFNSYWSTITNCYSMGSVSGTGWAVGGFVGDRWYGTVTRSFWDIQTSGQTTSAGGTGKTTAEMQMESTFTDAGWDFVGESVNGTEDIWWILEGQDYPRLWWETFSELEN